MPPINPLLLRSQHEQRWLRVRQRQRQRQRQQRKPPDPHHPGNHHHHSRARLQFDQRQRQLPLQLQHRGDFDLDHPLHLGQDPHKRSGDEPETKPIWYTPTAPQYPRSRYRVSVRTQEEQEQLHRVEHYLYGRARSGRPLRTVVPIGTIRRPRSERTQRTQPVFLGAAGREGEEEEEEGKKTEIGGSVLFRFGYSPAAAIEVDLDLDSAPAHGRERDTVGETGTETGGAGEQDYITMRASTTPQHQQQQQQQRPGSAAGDRRRSLSVTGGPSGGHTALRTSFGRGSVGGGGSGSGIPRASMGGGGSGLPVSRLSAMRATTTQPSYDFLTGGAAGESTSAHASRTALRERISSASLDNQAARDRDREKEDRELAELRAEVKTLKYTIHSNEQEKEVTTLRQESEIREVRRKAEEDFRKMQEVERERSKAVRLYEEIVKELAEVKERAEEEKRGLEKRLRDEGERCRGLEEEVEDKKSEADVRCRGLERDLKDGEGKVKALAARVEELVQEGEKKDDVLREVQQRLGESEAKSGELESEVLRLKAQTGDVDTLGVIKRELSEQVAHIRTLEATNREQAAELKHFRRLHKSVEVVEEEKRALQRKVDAMEDLQQELGEARLQRQMLEDERLAWTAYLQSQAGEDGQGQLEFGSPEAVARALVQGRLETATLTEKLGNLEPAIAERDVIIKSLEGEKKKLEGQVEKLKAGGSTVTGTGGDQKSRLRLERQRTLALKEVEYLRAQLKALDAEESTMELESYDAAKAKRITELEDLVVQYSTEVQTLQTELATKESSTAPEATSKNNKRPRSPSSDTGDKDDEENNELAGQLARKNRKLQSDLSSLSQSLTLTQKELSATRDQLSALQSHRQTRILTLRQNPTAEVEAIKMSTLTTLRAENEALLSQLKKSTSKKAFESVPLASLEAKELELAARTRELASAQKSIARLKQVWGAKTAEFREGVRSLLGWKVDFLPNGKLRVGSLFLPGSGGGGEGEEGGGGDENTIVFDGEKGTMKVSGGPRSEFARRIKNQIRFWVEERGEIPCLLAALTLEFWEESTRAAGGGVAPAVAVTGAEK